MSVKIAMSFVMRPTVHPNGERGIGGIFSRFKEPEVGIDFVCLVLDTEVGKCSSWKVDIARETSYAFCCFAEIGLK
jgi:hypothetical protein